MPTRTLHRLRRWGATALLAAALAAPGCGEAPNPTPNLVLIVIDTLRADHLGAYGYPRETSRNFDRLAARGTLFLDARAPSSWTRPSVASLFTSRLPSEHRANTFARSLAPDVPTLAGMLRQAGYRTLGVSGNFVHVNEGFGLARGFDVWHTVADELRGGTDETLWQPDPTTAGGRNVKLGAPSAKRLNNVVKGVLDDLEEEPFFLYVHYMDPHSPYDPPNRYRRPLVTDPAAHEKGRQVTSEYLVELARTRAEVDPGERQRLIDLYDAEIAQVDAALGDLLAELERRGLSTRTVVTVASDHGEEFGDHDRWFHGVTLYRESLAVPLLIADPRRHPTGVRRDEPVDLLDISTTLLAMAGVPPAPGMRGRDLLAAGALPPRDRVAELQPEERSEFSPAPRVQRLALERDGWKLIRDHEGHAVVYDTANDPGEQAPLEASDPRVPAGLVADAEALEARLGRLDRGEEAVLDEQTLEGLRALGYVK